MWELHGSPTLCHHFFVTYKKVMWSSGVAKLMFLLIVVVVVGFAASKVNVSLETFEDPGNAEAAINRIHSRLLDRLPTQAELEDYAKLMARGELSEAELEAALKKSDEFLEKEKTARKMTQRDFDEAIKKEAAELFKDSKDGATVKKDGTVTRDPPARYADTKLYHEIVDVFDEVLMRNPTAAEMDHFYETMRLKKKEFDSDKLRTLLLQTNEYHILKKNQLNTVDTDLPGNASDRQVRLAVRQAYQKVFGAQPSPQAEEYLRTKFIEFQLDMPRFEAFLRALKAFEAAKDSGDFTVLARVLQQPDMWARLDKSGSGTDKSKLVAVDGFSKDALDIKDFGWDADDLYSNLFASQATMNDAALRAIMAKQTLLDKDACALQADKRDGTMLAKLQKDRNAEQQKMECQRFSKYVNADDNMVLNPEFKWSVPQRLPPPCIVGKKDKAIVYPSTDQSALIGTLLQDAKDTKVGSIMPKFTFTEA